MHDVSASPRNIVKNMWQITWAREDGVSLSHFPGLAVAEELACTGITEDIIWVRWASCILAVKVLH
jgi:hypothetical protein